MTGFPVAQEAYLLSAGLRTESFAADRLAPARKGSCLAQQDVGVSQGTLGSGKHLLRRPDRGQTVTWPSPSASSTVTDDRLQTAGAGL